MHFVNSFVFDRLSSLYLCLYFSFTPFLHRGTSQVFINLPPPVALHPLSDANVPLQSFPPLNLIKAKFGGSITDRLLCLSAYASTQQWNLHCINYVLSNIHRISIQDLIM